MRDVVSRITLLLVSLTPAQCTAEISGEQVRNWPQWRGPRADGFAPLGDPPTRWSESTNVRWKTELPGSGSATPVVWEDHVFILTAVATEREASAEDLAQAEQRNEGQKTRPATHYHRFLVLDIDRHSGETRWQRVACEALPHEGLQATNTYASASPITDGRFVYAFFGSRGIYCYDFEGNLRWSRNLGEMRTRYGWGEGASPALFQDTLFVNWDHEGPSFLTALDAATGATRWQVDRDEPTSWSTPLVVDQGHVTQVIVSATNRIRSYDASNGEVLWECAGLTTNVIPSPVVAEDTVICMSWYGEALVKAVSLGARGDTGADDGIRWTFTKISPYCPSPLVFRDRIILNRANTGVFALLDVATGQTTIGPARLPGIAGEIYASPVAAADRLYFVDREGTTVVLRYGEELELLAVNHLEDHFDASPAIVGSQLLLRGRKHLYCLEEQVPK